MKELELIIEKGNQKQENMEANLKNLKDKEENEKVFVWRSARFDPDWAKKNLSLMEDFGPKLTKQYRLRVVFFLPHWDYNVHKIKTLEAINEISSDTSTL